MMQNQTGNIRKAAVALLSMQRHSWEQGVAMQAFLEMGEREVVIALAHEAVSRSTEDGRPATIGVTDAVTDPCSVGEALLAACQWTKDPFLLQGRDALIRWALHRAPKNAAGVLYHLMAGKQFWADSLYMLPPFLLAAGYKKEALANFYGYYQALFDPGAGLMGHMWDDENKRFLRKAHWGTGNGWTAAAIARMVPMLPGSEGEALAGLGRALVDALLPLMTADGRFHDVVDDQATFVETNLSQMLAYALYRGMKTGWLPQSYLPFAEKMRGAANRQMNPYGFITEVCGAPGFDKPGFSPEGQAFYLLMENAAAQ